MSTGTFAITPEIVAEHGIRPGEYETILEVLGREPSPVELGIFSVMWSEHCSYKHSKPVLKRLPTTGERVLVGPGENAGIIDLGDGVCVAFKMESHNHPSAVEPFQGAATGVGGILRDIFTMGARPVAMLNNLRFGEPDSPHMQHLIEGVVEGIAGYGNCVGVPTVAGDIAFDPVYAGNILVNAMCVGVARVGDIRLGTASGVGNQVLYFGSATGRDGIHGATFASEELNEEAVERRGAVQVGDPFMGKKILEATLELIRRGLVVGIQDMGAAGLTCSTAEMAGRAGTGVDVDLDLVPQRARDLSAYEIMLSESQERMLAVCKPEDVAAALEVCDRWECGGVIIGTVTDNGRIVIRHRGSVVAEIPAAPLTDRAPVYHPDSREPAPHRRPAARGSLSPRELRDALPRLLASPTVASKRWAYRQYDHQVQANTVLKPGEADAAVLRIRASDDAPEKLLAVASDGCSRWVARDPFVGGMLSICETARNLVCSGAQPLGVTNCLNFGSPERPEVFWTFQRAIDGMAEACRALGVPVTGGNVSLYNEHNGIAIPPTPMIGMVGQVDSSAMVTRQGWTKEGARIVVLGGVPCGLAGSEFAKLHDGPDRPGEPLVAETLAFDLAAEVALQRVVLEAIRRGGVCSAHDVTEGGLAAALAECCISSPRGLGARIEVAAEGDPVEFWFGELPPRVVASVTGSALDALLADCAREGVGCCQLGEVTGTGLSLADLGEYTRDELVAAFHTHPYL